MCNYIKHLYKFIRIIDNIFFIKFSCVLQNVFSHVCLSSIRITVLFFLLNTAKALRVFSWQLFPVIHHILLFCDRLFP